MTPHGSFRIGFASSRHTYCDISVRVPDCENALAYLGQRQSISVTIALAQASDLRVVTSQVTGLRGLWPAAEGDNEITPRLVGVRITPSIVDDYLMIVSNWWTENTRVPEYARENRLRRDSWATYTYLYLLDHGDGYQVIIDQLIVVNVHRYMRICPVVGV